MKKDINYFSIVRLSEEYNMVIVCHKINSDIEKSPCYIFRTMWPKEEREKNLHRTSTKLKKGATFYEIDFTEAQTYFSDLAVNAMGQQKCPTTQFISLEASWAWFAQKQRQFTNKEYYKYYEFIFPSDLILSYSFEQIALRYKKEERHKEERCLKVMFAGLFGNLTLEDFQEKVLKSSLSEELQKTVLEGFEDRRLNRLGTIGLRKWYKRAQVINEKEMEILSQNITTSKITQVGTVIIPKNKYENKGTKQMKLYRFKDKKYFLIMPFTPSPEYKRHYYIHRLSQGDLNDRGWEIK